MKRLVIIGVAIGSFGLGLGVASADPAPGEQAPAEQAPAEQAAPNADLRVHQLPAKKTMAMRPKQADKEKSGTTTAAAGDASAAADSSASTSSHFDRIPTTWADLRDRVIFRLNAGYEIDSAPTSGATLLGGTPLAPGFTNNRSWLSGNAVIGAHDIILPSLGG